MPESLINFFPLIIFLVLLDLTKPIFGDYSLACNPGYRVSAIKRSNSPRQRGKVGSISIECQPILPSFGEIDAKCEPRTRAPECNGESSEGCSGSQWLGGFNVYKIHNLTNAILLDPICCSSTSISVDPISCASERLNFPRGPFEHSISSSDFVYRGIQCWHQYDQEGTAVDLIWKIEICQINNKRKTTNGTLQNFENCPPCECNCGINICGNGDEPIRVIHKNFFPKKCACDCICRYECSIE